MDKNENDISQEFLDGMVKEVKSKEITIKLADLKRVVDKYIDIISDLKAYADTTYKKVEEATLDLARSAGFKGLVDIAVADD